MRKLPAIPSLVKIMAGAVVAIGIAVAAHQQTSPNVIDRLERRAETAIEQADGGDIRAEFRTESGLLTRHPRRFGGADMDDDRRAKVARAISNVRGVGGVHWADKRARARLSDANLPIEQGPYHCERDVEALLAVRVIRFEQSSSQIDPDSASLLDEVASALLPCKGSIIAVTGHSDASGDEAINRKLSRERARAVRGALVRRGLPRDSLRATGVGSSEPIDGLAPEDPANRRIEFSVIEVAPLTPTPVDTPDAG